MFMYENLKNDINELFKERPEVFRGTTPEFREVEKPTGKVYQVSFVTENETVAPAVNLEAIIDCMNKNSCDLEEALDILFDELEQDEKENRVPDANYFTDTLSDKEKTLKEVTLQMVPMEATDEYLRDKTTTSVADMKAMCVLVQGGGRVVITNDILERLDITADELVESALKNQQVIEAKAMDMRELLISMGAPEEFVNATSGATSEMVVLVSDTNGAAVILNDDVMQKAAQIFEADKFVILPSSIFEVIAIPYTDDYEKLENMIQEVNAGQVAPQDRLSDKPYIYDAKTKTIEMFERNKENDKDTELELE